MCVDLPYKGHECGHEMAFHDDQPSTSLDLYYEEHFNNGARSPYLGFYHSLLTRSHGLTALTYHPIFPPRSQSDLPLLIR